MIELGLSRIISLLKLSPIPTTWKAIHITGTNGKGSVAAYLSSLLHQSGIRVGRFTSPHLIHRWDCISVNQSTVSEKLFLEVEKQVQDRNLAHGIKATEFEILTATAFEVFQRQNVQVGVVECGLGGLRDATNALGQEDVLVSIVTKIGLDHVDFLGGTVQEIAWEKSGIFRKGTPIVVDESNLVEVLQVLDRRKSEVQAGDLIRASPVILDEFVHESKSADAIQNLPLHQQQNLSVALEAFRLATRRLLKKSFPISSSEQNVYFSTTTHSSTVSEEQDNSNQTIHSTSNIHPQIDLDQTITEVRQTWQGRLQWLDISSVAPNRTPTNPILLDGAHNTQSAEVLREYIDRHLLGSYSSTTQPNHPSSPSSPQLQTQTQPHSEPQSSSSTTQLQPLQPQPHQPLTPLPNPNSITFLLSLKSDKSPSSILPILLRSDDKVITCPFPSVEGMPWVKPLPSIDLAKLVSKQGIKEVFPAKNVKEGIEKAVETADGNPLVVAGSLYLVGEVLRLIESKKGGEGKAEEKEEGGV